MSIFMIQLRVRVLFLLFLPGGARRTFRSDDSHHDAQQQLNTLANGLKVSVEAREALNPGGLRTRVFRRVGPQVSALPKQDGWRAGHLKPHRIPPWSRFGPRRAKVALQDANGSEEDLLPPKEGASALSLVREYDKAEEKALRQVRLDFGGYPAGKYWTIENEAGGGKAAAFSAVRVDHPVLKDWSDGEIQATLEAIKTTPLELLIYSPIGPVIALSALSIFLEGSVSLGIPPCSEYINGCPALPTLSLPMR